VTLAAPEDTILNRILGMTPELRRAVMLPLEPEERDHIAQLIQERIDNPFFRFRGNHRGFVKDGLGEGTWSIQDQILSAVDKYKRVVVVATHSIGKSHIGSRVVLGTGCTWQPGLARITTTATNYRQVSNILWPYIRRTHNQYHLPGEVLKSPQWKIGNELIGDGFSAAASDETATQGMHANGEMLLVVDEAGGISDILGRAFNALLTNEDAHALVFGNAPTDREGSWFERICQQDSGWHVIRVSAFDTPAFTGEETDTCTTCPPTIVQHRVSKHLTSKEWVEEVAREFGTDSAFYIARVLAQFPKNVSSKTLPMAWLESAFVDNTKVTKEEFIASLPPKAIRLGVDIASDGGDELAIAWVMGLNAWIGDATSGSAIASPRQAAQFILNQIQLAEQFHEKHGIAERVRLKYDAIGIGWAMGGILEEYRDQGRHNAELIPVDVSEKSSEPEKYAQQRSEMWWRMREWIEPTEDTGEVDPKGQRVMAPLAQLYMGMRELAQLNAPSYTVKNGRIQIETKESMRKRGRRSPDRGEAFLLGFFEPPQHVISVPDSYGPDLSQVNEWNLDPYTD
jgi:hypothetical protein